MNTLSIRCIRVALLCLVLGIGLGASFAVDRALGATLRPLHAELNLWGYVTLLIYGMAYHMLPRFAGHPLRWVALATLQSWLAIGGVFVASIGWLMHNSAQQGRILLVGGGILQFGAVVLFVLIIGELLVRPKRT